MEAADVRSEVLQLLEKHGPLARADLFEKSPLLDRDDAKALSNALYQLKQSGKVTQDEEKRWCLPEAGSERTSTGPAESSPAPAPPKARRPYKRRAKKADEEVEQLLRENAEAAREAAQRYIDQLGDPVLSALLDAASRARDTLARYQEVKHG